MNFEVFWFYGIRRHGRAFIECRICFGKTALPTASPKILRDPFAGGLAVLGKILYKEWFNLWAGEERTSFSL